MRAVNLVFLHDELYLLFMSLSKWFVFVKVKAILLDGVQSDRPGAKQWQKKLKRVNIQCKEVCERKQFLTASEGIKSNSIIPIL